MSIFHGDATRPEPLRTVACALLILSLGACSAPAERPLEPAELVRSLERRSAAPGDVARALELAGLAPQAHAVAQVDDPALPDFWHACAEAWSPAVRAARRRFEAAVHNAASAGAPGPIDGFVEIRDLGDPAADSRLALTFDLVGLFGLEPAAAARALADAEARSALGELEAARWRVRFEVDQARVRLGALRAARAGLTQLALEADLDAVRLAILERHGRLASGDLASAQLALRELQRARELHRAEESRAREALVLATGLAPDAHALDTVAGLPNEPPAESAPMIDPAALFGRLPALRVVLFDYAVAEARLRSAAAARWPDLGLGPHLAWAQPELLLGAIASAGLPWPGALDGRIAAASDEREAARERAEDALLAALARGAGARERLDAADALLATAAQPADLESARLWSAARARLSVDPAALMDWADALRLRASALAELEAARAERSLAQLELDEACGPRAGAPLLALAGEQRP